MNELYDEQLETSVLSILIGNSSSIFKIIRMYNPDVFYNDKHKQIAKAIKTLAEQGIAYDMIDVIQECKKVTQDNEYNVLITSINLQYISSASIEHKWMLLNQMWIKRQLIETCQQIITESKNPLIDVWDLFDNADQRLKKISDSYTESNEVSHHQAIKKTYEDIMLGFEGKKPTFWRSGFDQLDNMIMPDKKNILLAGGKSGSFKTKFIIQFMRGLLHNNKDVAISWYCMEDPSDKIIRVMISSMLRIPDKTISNKDKRLTQTDLDLIIQCKDLISEFDIEFYERPTLTKHIRSQFTSFCKKRPDKLNILIIDNLMCLADNDTNENQTKIDDRIAAAFQRIMNETEGLVILVHHFTDDQLSKMNLSSGYRPRESHLKGSTRYRDISTQIILINNPSQYPDVVEHYKDSPWINNLFLTDICKNRNNETGLIRWFADGNTNNFMEL